MACDLREEALTTIVEASIGESLTGQEKTISKAVSAILQASISLPAFIISVNEKLSAHDLQLQLPGDTFERKNLRTNSYGTYEAECRLHQISGGGPCLDTAQLTLIINRKSLIATALYQFATLPNKDTSEFLMWAFETDCLAGGKSCVEDGLLVEAVQDCNGCLAASLFHIRVAGKCSIAIAALRNGGSRVKYVFDLELLKMTQRPPVTIDHTRFSISIDWES